MRGYSENVTVDEGVDELGIRKQMHFEGDSLIVQKTYDAQPLLDYAEQARQATAGQNWGKGKLVGTIPMVEYAKFLAIKDNAERAKAIKAYLRENSRFVMFDRYLK